MQRRKDEAEHVIWGVPEPSSDNEENGEHFQLNTNEN